MIAQTLQRFEHYKVDIGLKLIGGAAEFQALVESNAAPRAAPGVFVFPASETGGRNDGENFVAQFVDGGIAVVSVVSNVADAKGAAATLDMIELRKRERAKLLGWAPDGYAPIEFVRGALAAFRNGHLWWQDIYSTKFLIKGQ